MNQSFSLNVNQNQKQTLIITEKIKLIFHVLELPILELKNFLDKKIEENPLLEKKDYSFNKNYSNKKIDIDNIENRKSLYEHLMFQANISISKKDLKIAKQIIGNLNEKGFLDIEIEKIAKSLKIFKKKVLDILKIIQTFDPIGIGARSFHESLLIQLKFQKKENSFLFKLLKNHFNDFLKKRSSLFKKLNISKESFQNLKKDLKNDFRKPGNEI